MTLIEKIQALEKSIGFSIAYNDHKMNYQSVEEYLEDLDEENIIDRNKMIETGNIVELQVYPFTPIGFYKVVGYTLESVIDKMLIILERN